jgi:hypothetical protein
VNCRRSPSQIRAFGMTYPCTSLSITKTCRGVSATRWTPTHFVLDSVTLHLAVNASGLASRTWRPVRQGRSRFCMCERAWDTSRSGHKIAPARPNIAAHRTIVGDLVVSHMMMEATATVIRLTMMLLRLARWNSGAVRAQYSPKSAQSSGVRSYSIFIVVAPSHEYTAGAPTLASSLLGEKRDEVHMDALTVSTQSQHRVESLRPSCLPRRRRAEANYRTFGAGTKHLA